MLAFTELSAFGVAGILGVALYIGTYAALQFGFLRGRGYSYAALNLAASACVLVSLMEAFNLSSALIQISWLAISIVGMARYYFLSNHLNYTTEEEALLIDAQPYIPRSKARKFLDLGVWIDGHEGTQLTHEGEALTNLVYLSTGEATVVSKGAIIAECGEKTMIGELTALSGEPATATVTLTKPSRLFVVSALALRAQIRRDPELHAYLESCFAVQMIDKLKRTTAALSSKSAVAQYGN